MQNIEFGIKMVVNTVFVIFLISYDGLRTRVHTKPNIVAIANLIGIVSM